MGSGLIERVKPGVNSIASEDDYILKDRKAFEELYKPKMQFAAERINTEFFKHFNETRPDDVPVGLHLGSVLGEIRNMVSVVGMSELLYDEDETLFADISIKLESFRLDLQNTLEDEYITLDNYQKSLLKRNVLEVESYQQLVKELRSL